jgi:hypothetical protein
MLVGLCDLIQFLTSTLKCRDLHVSEYDLLYVFSRGLLVASLTSLFYGSQLITHLICVFLELW